MLGGLDIPTSGSVKIRGREIGQMNDEQLTVFRRRNIGFVFQNYNLVPILNVYQNIVLPIELDGNKVDKAYVNKIIQTLHLEGKLDNLPNNLSGGQQQRVAIAGAGEQTSDHACRRTDRKSGLQDVTGSDAAAADDQHGVWADIAYDHARSRDRADRGQDDPH